MTAKQDRAFFLVWALLVGVTLLSWAIGANNGHAQFARNPAITWGVLLIAAFKVRLILRQFMEVRHAPDLLRRLTDLWLLLAIGALLVIYAFQLGITI